MARLVRARRRRLLRDAHGPPGRRAGGLHEQRRDRRGPDESRGSHGSKRPLYKQLVDGCPKAHVVRDALSLISEQLGTNRIDYAFVYRVHASDLRLPFIRLPDEINLGSLDHLDDYRQVQALVPNFRGGQEALPGTYIAFGITTLREAIYPEGARAFVRFALSSKGLAILRRSEFVPIQPAMVPRWGSCPAFLEGLAVAEGSPAPKPPPQSQHEARP